MSLLLDSDAVELAAVCCASESVVLACAKLEIFVADAAAGVGIPPTLWATGDADGIPPLPEDSNGPFESSIVFRTGRSNLGWGPEDSNGPFESRMGPNARMGPESTSCFGPACSNRGRGRGSLFRHTVFLIR